MKKVISLNNNEYFNPKIEAKKLFIKYKSRDPLSILIKLGYECYCSTIMDRWEKTYDLSICPKSKQVYIDNGLGEKLKTFCLTYAVAKIIYDEKMEDDYAINLSKSNEYLTDEEIETHIKYNKISALFLIDKDRFLSKYTPLKKYNVEESHIVDFLSAHFKIHKGIIEFLIKEYVKDDEDGKN